jgi:DNA gyrase inhibitor GyrI
VALDISIQERPALPYLGIPLTARLSEFGAPDGPNAMIPRVYQWLADHAVVPQGGPLYVYRHVGAPDEPVDLTVAVPVAEPVKPSHGLVFGSLPAGTYVVGRHVGAPDRIPASHSEVQKWAAANGHLLDVLRDDHGALWTGHAEHFLTDPAEEPDASKWITELLFKTA